jgi:hypothetical protein
VQNIYRGWALFGIVLFGALIANLVLAILLRGRGTPFVFALFCFLLHRAESIGHEWMRPNTTSVMLYTSISHRNPQWGKRNDGAAFLRVGNRLVSVRKHFESFESFVIQQW